MSELADRITMLTRAAPNPTAAAAAVRAIMWRVEKGLLDPDGARQALEHLGLAPAAVAGVYRNPQGRVDRNKTRRDRRCASPPSESA